jgi:hypothetical protein
MAGANGSAATDPKLTALREAMSAANGGQGVHAYIVPSEDPHMVRHTNCGSPAHPALRRTPTCRLGAGKPDHCGV